LIKITNKQKFKKNKTMKTANNNAEIIEPATSNNRLFCVHKSKFGVNKKAKFGYATLLSDNLWLFQEENSEVKLPVETSYLTFI
jgi:hypothetical protein